jgi:hypothetical protein
MKFISSKDLVVMYLMQYLVFVEYLIMSNMIFFLTDFGNHDTSKYIIQ